MMRKELIQKVQAIGKPIFENIYTYSLKDNEVTRESISKKINEIARSVGLMIFYSLSIRTMEITNENSGTTTLFLMICSKLGFQMRPQNGQLDQNWSFRKVGFFKT